MPREIINNPALPRSRSPHSNAVKVGNLIFVSGFPGYEENVQVSKGDFAAQMRQALKHIRATLEYAGSSIDKIAKVNIYLDRRERPGHAAQGRSDARKRDPSPRRYDLCQQRDRYRLCFHRSLDRHRIGFCGSWFRRGCLAVLRACSERLTPAAKRFSAIVRKWTRIGFPDCIEQMLDVGSPVNLQKEGFHNTYLVPGRVLPQRDQHEPVRYPCCRRIGRLQLWSRGAECLGRR